MDYSSEKYHDDTNKRIKHNMSKYSYTFMCEQRNKGVKVFNEYVKELKRMGFASSVYFYVYYVGLLLLGKNNCTKIITELKSLIGHRPNL